MLDLTQLSGKQRQLLRLLQEQLPSRTAVKTLRSLCSEHHLDFNFVKGFLLSGLLAGYVDWEELAQTRWTLSDKGATLGGQIPGATLAAQLLQGVTELDALQQEFGQAFSVNYGALRKEQAVDLQSSSVQGPKLVQVLRPEILKCYQERQAVFAAIAAQHPVPPNSPHLAWLQQQSYITPQSDLDYSLTLQPRLATLDLKPLVTTLTSDLLLSDQWQQVTLKPYNLHDPVADIAYGRPTILTQCIQRIRDIFLNMGFDEMSGYLVETAFWNFDVLFTPQDHPAREVQDTFYLNQPQTLPLPNDLQLVEQVQQVHESNYGGIWTETEASRAMLRAHTTSSTARKLYALQGEAGKYFSIEKVFRNETVDRTHLAEFHQIEGVVIGDLLSVRTLMGYLTDFYERLGFKTLKFQPTYNPYTEPSLEVYAYHPPSQKYLEVGNSGLFRPEMLEPLGCGGQSTIAWGLGLERIAMLLYDVEKLSDLVGPESCLNPV
jgi:phenylalanyl-tRNA synthetase alpha chain